MSDVSDFDTGYGYGWSGPSSYAGSNRPVRSRNFYMPRNQVYARPRNRGAQEQREVDRASKLAGYLWDRGLRSEHLETTHPNILRHYATSAGVEASDSTWSLTHRLLRRRQTQD